MLFWTYNALLILALPFVLPFMTVKALLKKKRAPLTFFKLPKATFEKKVIWIHAVSLGEVNTARPLIETLKSSYPDHQIAISVITETGFFAASQIKDIFAFYLPYDLSILQRNLINRLRPKLFIYIEGDVWPSLSRALKRKQIPVCILSAKLSLRSLSRLKKLKALPKLLYGHIDEILCQDESMRSRFEDLGLVETKLSIGGNLKLAQLNSSLCDREKLTSFLSLDFLKKTIVIASTHAKEEELILEALGDVSKYNIILAPRHPQRFQEVRKLLDKHHIPFKSFQNNETCQGVFYLDAIGYLSACYKHADLAILGGSFVDHIGGHNVIEPIFYGCPVIVGPYAYSQRSLVKLMVEKSCGLVATIPNLKSSVEDILSNPIFKEQTRLINQEASPILDRALSICQKYLK